MSRRCKAITLASKKCRRVSLRDEEYCSQHQLIIDKCADVGQANAVHYSPDDNGPGLLEEIWKLVGEPLWLLDLRRLYLTCKTLFRLFTYEGRWFSHHPRYLHIEADDKIWIGPQDETTKTLNNEQLGTTYKIPLGQFLVTSMICKKAACSLTSINSYAAARKVFRLLARTHTYIRDIDKSQIEAYSYEMSLQQAETVIPRLVNIEGIIAVIFGRPLRDKVEFLEAFTKHMKTIVSCDVKMLENNTAIFLFSRKVV